MFTHLIWHMYLHWPEIPEGPIFHISDWPGALSRYDILKWAYWGRMYKPFLCIISLTVSSTTNIGRVLRFCSCFFIFYALPGSFIKTDAFLQEEYFSPTNIAAFFVEWNLSYLPYDLQFSVLQRHSPSTSLAHDDHNTFSWPLHSIHAVGSMLQTWKAQFFGLSHLLQLTPLHPPGMFGFT